MSKPVALKRKLYGGGGGKQIPFKYVYNKDILYQFYLCKFVNLSVLYLELMV